MRRPVWAWLALSSVATASVIAIAAASAATRPHYGGNLAVDVASAWPTPDAAASSALSIPITETLVRRNARGEIEPVLAVAWQHDPDFKRWRFSLRSKVAFHDGEPLTGATAQPALLAALKKKYADLSIETGGQALVIQSGLAIPNLLEDLAEPETAVSRTSDINPLIGTGPFRLTAWEPGRRLVVGAFDDYWNARPFLDSVSVQFGSTRDRADIFDLPVGPSRRILPEGVTTWSSAPRTLVAITTPNAQPAVLQALALVIDRAPIATVLAQRKAEVGFGLLPQWLSGYAFLFQAPMDALHARQIVAPLRLSALTLSYPANDAFLRSVAERVALSARDAGISIQPTPNAGGNLRLIEWQLGSTDAATELKRIADFLGAGDRASHVDTSKPASLYDFERSLLDDHRILPLVHLRETFGIGPHVHLNTSTSDSFALHLEDVWIQP
jgi:ABC-type transport system substrate-binding protein